MLRLGICGLPLEQIHFHVPILEADRRAVEAEIAWGSAQVSCDPTREAAFGFSKNPPSASLSILGGRRPGREDASRKEVGELFRQQLLHEGVVGRDPDGEGRMHQLQSKQG